MSIVGILTAINLFGAYKQKQSKARTFGIWLTSMALVLILLAIIIAIVKH